MSESHEDRVLLLMTEAESMTMGRFTVRIINIALELARKLDEMEKTT